MFAIKPEPNTGVGMRKMRLLAACAWANPGCGKPAASLARRQIGATGYREYGLDAAVRVIDVGRAVGVKEEREAGFAHRAVLRNKRRDGCW